MSRYGHGQQGGGGVRPRSTNHPHDRRFGGSRRGGGYGGDRDRSQPDQTVAQLWPGYLEGGYFDADGNLRIEYVSRCIPADELLPERQQHGVESLVRAMANADPKLTSHQLRRFFGHCRAIETKLKTGTPWRQIRPQFERLNIAASDGYGKQPRKIPGLFFNLIQRNVAAVTTEKDFLAGFLPHFEALVGFGSLYLSRERN